VGYENIFSSFFKKSFFCCHNQPLNGQNEGFCEPAKTEKNHGRPPREKISREIFSRGASAEKNLGLPEKNLGPAEKKLGTPEKWLDVPSL